MEGLHCHQPQVHTPPSPSLLFLCSTETPNLFLLYLSFRLFPSASEGVFSITWPTNGSNKTVSRLNLMFESEDPARHIQRRSAAVKRREMYEQSMRYNVFVRGLPVEDQLKPSMEQVLSIFKRAGAMVTSPPPPFLLHRIIITDLFD